MSQEQEVFGSTGTHNPVPDFARLKSDAFDPFSFWDRIGEDFEMMRELVDLFAQETPELLKAIEDAVQQGSAVDVQRFSHKMKGSALQFSGTAAVVAAAALENMGKEGRLEEAPQAFARLSETVANLKTVLHSMAYGDAHTE